MGLVSASRRDGMLVDAELIERARNRDDAAFGEIVQAYRRRVLGTIGRLIGRREDVEDVGQQAFFCAYAFRWTSSERRRYSSRGSIV